MKKSSVLFAVAILAAGCDQQKQASNNTATTPEKNEIRQSAREAKSEVDKQARAQKEMLDSEAKAAQAKIDAEKARTKAESTEAQTKVDTASQSIRDAAGTAGAKVQTEVGAAKSATDSDQKLADQVRTAVNGGTAEATTDASKNIQVSASGGTVTIKGTVKSDTEKSRIETAAKAVPGVTKVENQLEVKAE
jgi:hyperosmotically inducible periplasmic protein